MLVSGVYIVLAVLLTWPKAMQIEVPVEPDEGVVADAPLVFCYGHTDVSHNMDVYTTQVKR